MFGLEQYSRRRRWLSAVLSVQDRGKTG